MRPPWEEFIQINPISEFQQKESWWKSSSILIPTVIAADTGIVSAVGAGIGFLAKQFNKERYKNATKIGAYIGAGVGFIKGATFGLTWEKAIPYTPEGAQLDSYDNYLNNCLKPFRKQLGFEPGSFVEQTFFGTKAMQENAQRTAPDYFRDKLQASRQTATIETGR